MRIKLQALYTSEGYRVESMNTDGEGAQVNLVWDERCRPRCPDCAGTMRINRKTKQVAFDLPWACAGVVAVVYEAVQGFCTDCHRIPNGSASGHCREPSGDAAADAPGVPVVSLAADASGLRSAAGHCGDGVAL